MAAAVSEMRKGRLIGRANLNEDSFSRYSGVALQQGLLRRTAIGFRATDRGKDWLNAANLVIQRRTELATAVEDLTALSVRDAEGRSAEGRWHRWVVALKAPPEPAGALVEGARVRLPPTASRAPIPSIPSGSAYASAPTFAAGSLSRSAHRPLSHDAGAARAPVGRSGDKRKRFPEVWPGSLHLPPLSWLVALGSAIGMFGTGVPIDGGLPA